MVHAILRTACLLAALALAALPAAAASPSDNADDGLPPSDVGEPCPIVVVGLEWPFVDLHPECIQVPP